MVIIHTPKNLDVANKAREHSVAIVSLPPHSMHKMKPLYVGLMKPLKTYYAQEIERWLGSNHGHVVTPFVVCKLIGPAYRRTATMGDSLNSFIKTGLLPCNRHTSIFRDHEYTCHGTEESQDKRTDGAGNEISRPGTSNVSFHNASGGKFLSPSNVRPIPHLTPKYSAHIDQTKQSRARCAKLLTASPYREQLRECQEKKVVSLSQKPAIKRLFGTKSKMSSKKRKAGIQESTSESDKEIEYESDDSGDDISDVDVECLKM